MDSVIPFKMFVHLAKLLDYLNDLTDVLLKVCEDRPSLYPHIHEILSAYELQDISVQLVQRVMGIGAVVSGSVQSNQFR